MNKQRYVYTPNGGVCSRQMVIELEDNIITEVTISKGCQGNSRGISALIKGMSVEEAIRRMEGITCGSKNTSCPDQLAQALKIMINDH